MEPILLESKTLLDRKLIQEHLNISFIPPNIKSKYKASVKWLENQTQSQSFFYVLVLIVASHLDWGCFELNWPELKISWKWDDYDGLFKTDAYFLDYYTSNRI